MSKYFLDTNIFLRHFIKDIPNQAELAERIFIEIRDGSLQGYVSILVVNELIWILENYYKVDRQLFIPQVVKILLLENIVILEISKDILLDVLSRMLEATFDFTDVYLAEVLGEDDVVVSFDKDFDKLGVSRVFSV